VHIQRVITIYDPELAHLPAELKAVLKTADRHAIRAGPPYFSNLARQATYSWLRKVLQKSGKCKGWHVEFTSADQEPLVPYFRLYWGGTPGLCLPRGGRLPLDLPPVLAHLYTILGGFRENEFGCAGGIYRADSLVSLSEFGTWIDGGNQVDPNKAIPFLSTLSGDMLCYLRCGGGGWYRHEIGRVEKVTSLEQELDKYFGALLDGDRI
jgi:hypothetical protein